MIRTLLLDADGVVQRMGPAAWRAIEAMTPRRDKQGFVTAIMEAERPCLSGLSDFSVTFASVLEEWECRASLDDALRRWNDIQTDVSVLDVNLGPGELFVVPKGVLHRPVATEEAHILLIEPSGTPNTGDAATAAARRVI